MLETSKKPRRSTSYAVSFPTLPTITVQPRSVALSQKTLRHDILLLEYPVTSEKWVNVIKTGIPIQFDWNQLGISNTFYGYVSYISNEVASQQTKMMKIYCLGSSFPLKSKKPRVFIEMTIPQVVAEIVSEYGLNFIGEDNSAVFEQLIISGISDWEWITEQATKLGYCIIVDGLDFIFKSMDTVIDQSVSNAPVLSFTESDIPTGVSPWDRTLDYFEVLNGEFIETNRQSVRTTKLLGGVNPYTTEVITVSASPETVGKNVRLNVGETLFEEQVTTQVVPNAEFGEVMSKGAAHMARFTLPARVKCQGDPRIRPYSPVYVQGTGKNTDGYWVAKEVKHLFHRIGEYQIEMTIATDGVGENNYDQFRQQGFNIAGKIDVSAAVNGGINTNGNSRRSKVYLETPVGIFAEQNQGFKRTPTTWKAVNKK